VHSSGAQVIVASQTTVTICVVIITEEAKSRNKCVRRKIWVQWIYTLKTC